MSLATARAEAAPRDPVPDELVALMDRVRSLPPEYRSDLEPIVLEVLESARFRGRVLTVAREALERLHLDLAMTRFDLDATRREREDLRRRVGEADEG